MAIVALIVGIVGLSISFAAFTEPGQSAVYKFYAYNAGELNAFLKSIVFSNVADSRDIKREIIVYFILVL